MNKIHQKLVKTSKGYRTWHSHPRHRFWHWVIFLSVVVAVFVFLNDAFKRNLIPVDLKAAGETVGPLRVHPTNRRYFMDGLGNPVYLTGSNAGWEMQDNAWDTSKIFNFDDYLALLQRFGHNLIRLWMVEHTRSAAGAPNILANPMPYKRTGGASCAATSATCKYALDGGLAFDLDQWDESYFTRLESRVRSARDRNIYVAVMLFQGVSIWDNYFDGAVWQPMDVWFGHYFNVNNNVNGVNGDPNGDGKGFESHSLVVPGITQRQEAYVKKVVDTVNHLNNVTYEISNEDWRGTVEWQYQMTNFINSYQATKPNQHPIGMTMRSSTFSNDELFANTNAAWISPYTSLTNPAVANGRKVIILDTDHIAPGTKDATFPWRSLMRGNSTLILDNALGVEPDTGQYDPIRKSAGYARNYANRVNLAAMTPQGNLSTTNFALANLGVEYLVYQPVSGRSFTVKLVAGTYTYEWFSPVTGTVVKSGTIKIKGGARSFSADFSGDAVLYLKVQ